MRAKVYKQQDDYKWDLYIENIEYLVKLVGVYINDIYKFITVEEDKRV